MALSLQNPLYSVGLQGTIQATQAKTTRTISGLNLPADIAANKEAIASDLDAFARLYFGTTTTMYGKTTLTTKQEVTTLG